MKKQEIYPPLKLIEEYASIIPWEEMEKFRRLLREIGNTWYDGVYMPVWGVFENLFVSSHVNVADYAAVGFACAFTSLFAWRRWKEVYRFAPEMEQMLYRQTGDCRLPVEILLHLPFPCIYIETSILCEGKYHGFFVCLDQKRDQSAFILRFTAIIKDSMECEFFNMEFKEGTTLEKGILAADLEGCFLLYKKTKEIPDSVFSRFSEKKEILKKALQLVLYVTAQNADKKESVKSIRRGIELSGQIKDKYREVRVWDMGYRVVNRLSAFHEAKDGEPSIKSEKDGERKRRSSQLPHLRRGHWHTYWTGKRTGESRKAVLKWIAPTFINCKSVEKLPVTINQYKQPNDSRIANGVHD